MGSNGATFLGDKDKKLLGVEVSSKLPKSLLLLLF